MKSVEDLTAESSLVLHAHVERVESRWATTRRTIHTYTTLRVLEVLKGNPAGPMEITVRQIGGSADGYTTY